MLAFITTTTIHDGMTADYEALLSQVAEQSEAQEPGCLAFKVLRQRGRANSYLVVEEYVDEAALAAHREADYFKTAMAQLGRFLAAPPQMLVGESF